MLGATGESRRRVGVAVALAVALSVGATAPSVLASPPPEPASESVPEPAPEPQPEPEPEPDVGVGEVDGTTVAVGTPPVPPVTPTTVVVAVGRPPVPPKNVGAPVKPATVVNRPEVTEVEPPQAKVSAAAHQVTAGLAALTELL